MSKSFLRAYVLSFVGTQAEYKINGLKIYIYIKTGHAGTVLSQIAGEEYMPAIVFLGSWYKKQYLSKSDPSISDDRNRHFLEHNSSF